MPRNESGVFSRIPGTEAVADTTISSSAYNATIEDLVADANAARPVSAGGTGAATAAAARASLFGAATLAQADGGTGATTLGAATVTPTGGTAAQTLANLLEVRLPAGATRAQIQAEIDALSAGVGGKIILSPGTFNIDASGGQVNSRDYGLLLKSNVTIEGAGPGVTILRVANAADIDLLQTDRSAAQTNIALRNLTLDGNEANQSGAPEGFSLWAFGVTGLILENVHSLNPASWGIRIEQCSLVNLSNVTCDHSAESNSDGVHFMDTSNVTCSDIYVDTEGDDAFIIEALNGNCANYTISGLYVSARETSVPAAMRGLLLLGDVVSLSAERTISDITVVGMVAKNCDGQAVVLGGSSYKNISIQAVSDGCRNDLYIGPGVSGYPGVIENCSFDIVGRNSAENSIIIVDTFGTITGNRINALISNPGDGFAGAVLRGNKWTGNITLDYDPSGTKGTPLQGVVLFGADSELTITARGANTNLFLGGEADRNVIHIGHLQDAVTTDLEISAGSVDNRFIGGFVDGAIVNTGGASNKFCGVRGADTYGTATLNFATNGDGTATFAHGLSGIPVYVQLQLSSSAPSFHASVNSRDATNITVSLATTTGAAVTTGTYTFFWEARL